jgi:hypothetical protein
MVTAAAVSEIKSIISRYKSLFPAPHSKSDFWKPYMTGMAQRTAPFLIPAKRNVTFDSPPEMPILIFAFDTFLLSDPRTSEPLLGIVKKVASRFQSDSKPGAVLLVLFDEVSHLPLKIWDGRSPSILPPPAKPEKSDISVLLRGLDTVFVSGRTSGDCFIFDPNSIAFRLSAQLLYDAEKELPKMQVDGKRFENEFDYEGKTYQLDDFAWNTSGKRTRPLNINQNRKALPLLVAVTSSTERMDLSASRLFSKAPQNVVGLHLSDDTLEVLPRSL